MKMPEDTILRIAAYDWASAPADVYLLEQISRSRRFFNESLIESLESRPSSTDNISDDVLEKLSSQAVYEIAQFYFLLKTFGVTSHDALSQFIDSHNQRIAELIADRRRCRYLGLTPQRLEKALYGADAREKLLLQCGHGAAFRVRLDQSDLARFMVEIMSPETCRVAVLALIAAGYFTLEPGLYRAKRLVSSGGLEAMFGAHLTYLRDVLDIDIPL